MKIAIIFSDNDFYNCFYGVLQTINLADKWCSLEHLTKEQWATCINEIAYGSYLLFQNRFEYGDESQGKYLKEKYLRVTPDMILLGDEVDEYVKNTEWNNSETFILFEDGRFDSI
jgi:hypothetical protein